MAKLLFQGHGSFRITTDSGLVIYVDPYAGEGYDAPADIVLSTHEHFDHNRLSKVTQNEGCTVIRSSDALNDDVYKSFDSASVHIMAVPAYNKNHDRKHCVGYIIVFDGIKVYAAGDTSTTDEMKEYAGLGIDYALLPTDGVYNMSPVEASACAELIGAKHAIPIHMAPGKLFDERAAARFTAMNRLVVPAGEEIILKRGISG